MAITLRSNNINFGFSINGNSADLSGCEELVAAVSGRSIYVERLVISFGAAITISVGAGKTGDALTTLLVGPLYGSAHETVELVFTRPVKLAVSTALCVDASGAGNVTILSQGYFW